MRLSSHSIVVEDYPTQGEHLIYNTRTQALVKIDHELREILDYLSDVPQLVSPERARDIEALHNLGILVRDEAEEQQKLREHMRQLKYSYNQSAMTVTVLTTYACNLKCVYCFEEGSRTFDKMSPSTQDQTIGWLKHKVETMGYQRLHVNYYGGEPLLNQPAIDHISNEMQKWCNARGIAFDISIQTNGYLLTPEIVDRFKKYNLTAVRISVDGVGDDHDRNRPLRGGGGTFDRIMRNIENCVDKVRIAVSVGFENGDVRPIERLVEYFHSKGILHKLGQFIYSPINPTLGPQGAPEKIRGQSCMGNSEDKLFAEAIRKINVIFDKYKIPNQRNGMSTSVCPLVRENGGATIDQQGRLYKCNTLLGHPEFAVGHVTDVEYNGVGAEFRDLDVWKQCPVDCTYLPMCSGGCRMMAFVGGNKNFKVPACKKPYLNEMAPEFIKRDYDRMVRQQEKEDAHMKGTARAGQ